MRYDIIVIGAGTSAGFLLAFLDERGDARRKKILLLEKSKEPFRKIYASGNGRCNFSNTKITESSYYSIEGSDAWKKSAFKSAAKLDLKQFFHGKGIPSYSDEFGRLMPYTNSAKTIGIFFERYINASSVELKCYSQAIAISKNDCGFTVKYKHDKEVVSLDTGAVVYACGGSAYPQMGTDGSGFELLSKMGHRIVKQTAGIVPLETKETGFHELAGLKTECKIAVSGYSRKGELLFTKYGISGPNALYASNEISLGLAGGPVKIIVDFLPEDNLSLEYFRSLYCAAKEKSIAATFGGALNGEFIRVFMRHSHLKGEISPDEVKSVYSRLKNVELTVTKTRPMQEAQVSLGGVFADELDPASFESKLHKNLFVTGEAIDYTGGCGGYNIHWCAVTARGVADRLGETV